MSMVETARYAVGVHWQGGRLTRAWAFEKPDLRVATSPQFRGGVPGVWSPEELLVAATAACFALTLAAVAERMQIPLLRLDVAGTGRLGKRNGDVLGFTAIELAVHVETATTHAAERLEEAAYVAEERCLLAMALDVPVHVTVEGRGAS